MGMYVVRTADSGDLATPRNVARNGRAAAMSRRRALAAVPSGHGAPEGMPVATGTVAPARLGRALSMQRRRQLSQGKRALNGAGNRAAVAAGAPALIVFRGGAR